MRTATLHRGARRCPLLVQRRRSAEGGRRKGSVAAPPKAGGAKPTQMQLAPAALLPSSDGFYSRTMPKVLIADDSAVARVVLARRLRAQGLDVIEEECARGAASRDPRELACALLDLDLGDGSGADVAERLRAGAATLPIAFFTSTRSGPDVERARAMGPIFKKPEELDAAVDWVQQTGVRSR